MAHGAEVPRVERLGDIVMNLFFSHPVFRNLGGIIGVGVADIPVREFVGQVIDVARTSMGLTQTELTTMIGSHASNWNEWYHHLRRPLPTEGERTTWFINDIIFLRLEELVLAGPPPPPWPLRE
ncbi:unnamed protein product [Rotaria magnacalcarata]|uniref:Uncharacterized protein n=1 Tax=Rotaria magnacalcarata TaxID=392030 RepID=A0A815XD03_9BILA|nr:unnamed protein product [Rotaria magnacalcarata]CAF5044744.1 unnamed protein product [Rotaria magnacalcarata]